MRRLDEHETHEPLILVAVLLVLRRQLLLHAPTNHNTHMHTQQSRCECVLVCMLVLGST